MADTILIGYVMDVPNHKLTNILKFNFNIKPTIKAVPEIFRFLYLPKSIPTLLAES